MKLQQFMMRYLRKRGWVVFYLEERARKCNGDTCWMELYQDQLKRDNAETQHNWFCAKVNPNTDEGKFLLSLGKEKSND